MGSPRSNSPSSEAQPEPSAAAAHPVTSPCDVLPASSALRPGDRLFRGNRTEILLVQHPTFGLCAQKRLLDFCDVQSERLRVGREASLQMQARHSGVVPVLGYEEASLYRTYIRGPTLSEWVKSTQPALPLALSIVGDLCATMEELHQTRGPGSAPSSARARAAPIVHRDITPSNVYLEGGRALLSDFGLAFAVGEPLGPREFLQGSPRFLPPELLTGWAPSTACDVYQVALLLAWLMSEPLRKFVPPRMDGAPVGQLWAGAQAWHAPARQVLQTYHCDAALDPDPRARPSAQELQVLINS